MDWRRFQEPSTDGAPGIWTVEEALRYQAQGKWPTIPPTVPSWVKRGPDGALPVQQSEWTLGRGWVDGKPYATLDAYLRSAGGAFVRTGPATRYNAARQLVTDGPNVLRLDHDPVTGAALGARLEGQGATTRSIPVGGAVGEIGAGGAWPSPFVLWNNPGLTIDLLAIEPDGIEDGIPGIKLRIHGTMTSGSFRLQTAPSVTRPADGTPLAASYYCRAIAGSAEGLTFSLFTGNAGLSAAFDPFAPSRLSAGRITVGGPTTYGGNPFPWLQFVGAVGTVVDITILIGASNIDTGSSYASSAILTTASTGVRNADNLSFARAGTPEGTVVIRGRTAPGMGASNQTLFQWRLDNDNRIDLLRQSPDAKLRALMRSGGSVPVADIFGAAMPDSMDFAAALTWGPSLFALSLNGAPSIINTGYAGPAPVTSILSIGPNGYGGTVSDLRIYPKAYDPAQLPGMSAL